MSDNNKIRLSVDLTPQEFNRINAFKIDDRYSWSKLFVMLFDNFVEKKPSKMGKYGRK